MSAKIGSTDTRLQALSGERAKLLELLRERKVSASHRIRPCPRTESGRFRAVTSWAQQRLWFIDQLEGGSTAYNICIALRVQGMLDTHALRRALHDLVQRHEALRTVFVNVGGQPMQEIAPEGRFQLEVTDLRNSAREQRESQLKAHMHAESGAPFDLGRGPLIRGRLLYIDTTESVLLVTMHHIVSDGWSIGVILREVTELYGAYRMGGEPTLPILPIQYADYANWQRDWLQSEVLDRQVEYWRSQLADAPQELELPTDRPRPPVQRYRGCSSAVVLGASLTTQLNALARRQGMTLFMILYAGWAILMARLSGREDIVIGTPVANRRRPELEGLIGFFVNTIALRVKVRGDIALHEFFGKVKDVTLAAYDHQDLPFEQLVEVLRPQRSLNRHPVFQVMLVLQNAPRSEPLLSGLHAAVQDVPTETSKFDLLLSLVQRGEEIVGGINYDTDLFDQDTVARWVECYKILLQGMVSSEQSCIAELPMLAPRERQLVLEAFNSTQAEDPGESLIHQLFEEQACRTPTLVAVVHHDRSLTYAQLNAQANQLARYLNKQGVGAGQLVAICVERGCSLVVGVLAILKSGAAYVPLDPSYPRERLEYMLQDAAPSVVLTQQTLREQLPATSAHVVMLDAKLQDLAASSIEEVSATELLLTPDNLVYVIYTSGSTGRPKGIAMPHRAMVNLMKWHRREFGMRPTRVLQFAALSFDVAFQEIFSTLCCGGTLVLLDEWIRRDVGALLDLLDNQRIERLFTPPLMLQSLAEYSKSTGRLPRDLTDIITAGEQLRISPEIVDFFMRLECGRLHNHYGPSETHVVTALTLRGRSCEWPALPSIGAPIANTRIYILDAHRRPVPCGVIGEIYIAGANVAHGYVNRPELTRERFVSDPYAATAGPRMYKTGDLGRWLANGTIEYLGRNDEQVKIRGFRIELGEIEAQLATHPDIREAAVIAREDAPGSKRLVGYVTCRGECRPSVEDLRNHLRATLPEHMVPSAFVVLDCMPLTPSGKLDRRALPAPDISAYVTVQFDAPQGDVEQTVAHIWQELLLVERVGRQDDFFQIGGHSMLALKALFKINQAFGCDLRVADVYKNPTLMELAVRIGGSDREDRRVDLRREAALDGDLVACRDAPASPARAVLLTGATGFVGRFLLAQLLEDTQATIYCLIRAPHAAAATRLQASLSSWDLWRPELAGRVVAVAGDLRKRRLGVDESTYRILAENVDAIYHCATSMNHLETYAMAKAANVDSSHDMLRLAMTGRPKLINYISTLGVFSIVRRALQLPGIVDEDTSIDDEEHQASQGYVSSKWVSEKIFMNAGARGFACNIFRLGLMWADSQGGRYDELQRGYRIIKSSLLSGWGIEGYRFEMPPTPVDYAARSIVFLANQHPRGSRIFHIPSSPQAITGLFECCNETVETSLKLVSWYEWIRQVKGLHDAGWSMPVVPLLESAFSMDERALNEFRRSVEIAGARVSAARTQCELERAGIHAPVLNDNLVALCVESMLERDDELHALLAERHSPHTGYRVPFAQLQAP